MRKVTAVLALALASGQAVAYESGDWLLRAGLGGTMSSASGETVGGKEVGFSEHVRPALGLTYMVLDDWGVGAGALWTHGQNLYLGDDGNSHRLGTVRNTPVTFSLEYYLPKIAQGRFWLMAGWHFMRMSGDEYRAGAVPGFDRIDVDDGSGFMGGFGVDWDTGGKWSLSAALMASTAKADITLTGTGGRRQYETEPEPLMWQLGLSRRF